MSENDQQTAHRLLLVCATEQFPGRAASSGLWALYIRASVALLAQLEALQQPVDPHLFP